MVFVCGVDEAGRGPVIGPLVIAGVMIDENDLEKLRKSGAKDSKLLMHSKRIKIAEEIKKISKYKIIIIEPAEIDRYVESDISNLNFLEAEKTTEILNFLKPDKAIIDCPSPNKSAYERFLRRKLETPEKVGDKLGNNLGDRLGKNIEIIAEHKADSKFAIVGAASILAKIVREEEVKKIEMMTGQSIGTGYPSNPICQKFLKENWEKYPEIFRKSWVSWKNHKEAKIQKKLNDFD